MRERQANVHTPPGLRRVLREFGVSPRRSRGQNFLVDAGILARILAAAAVAPGDPVVEVGPGAGILTERLLQCGARVWAVEVDRRLCQLLEERRREWPQAQNLHLLCADARKIDWMALAEAIRVELGKNARERWLKVVANIPYSITTPLLLTFLELDRLLERVVLLVQREVAERLRAGAGSREYGAITVAVRSRFAVQIVGYVPATAFWPVPAVESAIIRLVPLPEPLVPEALTPVFTRVVRAAFGQRRKTLANALKAAAGWDEQAEGVKKALDAAGIDGRRRGETLTVEEFVALARELRDRLGGSGVEVDKDLRKDL